ncbi:hypothetical protein PAEPH01_0311 [Pancytospora epiphaga]|nr:hypothetical protein PAEPH01_0311 [Pancytospora epiphaga]
MKIIFTLFTILLFGAVSSLSASAGSSSNISKDSSSPRSFLSDAGASPTEAGKPADPKPSGEEGASGDQSFWQKHKKTILIIGGIILALIILGVVLSLFKGK